MRRVADDNVLICDALNYAGLNWALLIRLETARRVCGWKEGIRYKTRQDVLKTETQRLGRLLNGDVDIVPVVVVVGRFQRLAAAFGGDGAFV